jgi:hypothetical protein
MLQKIVKEISEEDAMIAFHMIDDNDSKTIDYNEIKRYYC